MNFLRINKKTAHTFSSNFSATVGTFPKEYELTFRDRYDVRFITLYLLLLLIGVPIVLWLSTFEPPEQTIDDYKQLLAKYSETVLDVQEEVKQEEVVEEGKGKEEEVAKEEPAGGQATEATAKSAGEIKAAQQQRLNAGRARAAAAAAAAASEAAAGVGVFQELVASGGYSSGGGAALSSGTKLGGGSGLDATLGKVGSVASSGKAVLGGGGGGAGGLGGVGGLDALGGSGDGSGIGGGTGSGSLKGSGKIANLTKPKVTGAASKNAYRNPEALQAVINGYRDAIQYCYESEKRLNPQLKGKVSVRIVIKEDGSVSGTTITSNSTSNKKVENCIVRNVSKWKFDEIDAGSGTVTSEFSYVFQ